MKHERQGFTIVLYDDNKISPFFLQNPVKMSETHIVIDLSLAAFFLAVLFTGQ